MKLRFLIFLLLLFIFTIPVKSQIHENSFLKEFRDTTEIPVKFIGLHSSYFASPFARIDLSNYFMLLHFTGNLKDKVRNSLSEETSMGMRICNELTFYPGKIDLFGIKRLEMAIRLENVFEQSLFLNKDLYTLLLYGNAGMLDKTAKAGPFNYLNINFQDLKFDFIRSSKPSVFPEIKYGLSVAVIKGATLNEISASRANIYTSPAGDSLHFDLAFEYRNGDPLREKWYLSNGAGYGLGGFLYMRLKNGNALYASVEDFGRIYWNNSSVFFKYDTNAGFTGYDIFNGSFTQKTFFLDTFSNMSENGVREKYTTRLKPRFNLCGFYGIPSWKTTLNAGGYYIAEEHLIPGFYLNAAYQINRRYEITPGFIFDHYKKMGFSLAAEAKIGSAWVASVGSYHVENIFVPLNNQSLYFSLKMMIE